METSQESSMIHSASTQLRMHRKFVLFHLNSEDGLTDMCIEVRKGDTCENGDY